MHAGLPRVTQAEIQKYRLSAFHDNESGQDFWHAALQQQNWAAPGWKVQ
jgi:hypothetical protein